MSILPKAIYRFSSSQNSNSIFHRSKTILKFDAVAETPKLWLPDMKSQFIGKDSEAGKDWRQKKDKEEAEDEMAR